MKPVSGAVAGLAHAIGEAASLPRARRGKRLRARARCEVCGSGDRLMEIRLPSGRRGTFDSFECAIHALAPICGHCGCRVVGHGVAGSAAQGADRVTRMFCSPHCASAGEGAP